MKYIYILNKTFYIKGDIYIIYDQGDFTQICYLPALLSENLINK